MSPGIENVFFVLFIRGLYTEVSDSVKKQSKMTTYCTKLVSKIQLSNILAGYLKTLCKRNLHL